MRRQLGFLAVALLLQGCPPASVVVPRGLPPDCGCTAPPPDVFRQVGIDADFAQSTLAKVILGTSKVKTEPKVVSLLSQAAMDARLWDYLRCLAIQRDKVTIEQAVYLQLLYTFLSRNPTAAEFIQWQREHPFPTSSHGPGTTEAVAAVVESRLPKFHRLTFQRGFVAAARFGPKEDTVLYSAAWNGEPIEVFSTQADESEPGPLGPARLPGTSILAVSSTGGLALSRERRPAPDIDPSVGLGILALRPPGVDVPRDVAESVAFADFAPDGKDLAIVRQEGPEMRLEYPIGHVLYHTAGWIGNARVSPDGSRVAFLDYATKSDRYGGVAVVDRAGTKTTLATGFLWQQGLAWSPGGAEVWFTAYRDGSPKALYAVSLAEKRERMILQAAEEMTLHDIARDGRVLLSYVDRRIEQRVKPPGSTTEHDLSWLDGSFLVSMSADGSLIIFNEANEAGGPMGGVYKYNTDKSSPPVRLSDAFPFDLSRDGKWILEFSAYHGNASQAVLLPTDEGKSRKLPTEPLDYQIGGFFPDGKRILLVASEQERSLRTYVQDLSGGKARPITPEGISATLPDAIAITPDGKSFVARNREGRAVLWPVDGGEPRLIPGFEPGEDTAMLFAKDGRTLLVGRFRELPMKIFRLNFITGRREPEPWAVIAPPDRTGVETLGWVSVTPDLRAYGYTYVRRQSELYLVDGLR